MILYCVRHGESAYNAQRRIQGQSDVPLSPLGHEQSRMVAAALARLPIDVVYGSPLSRALETARIVAKALKLEVRIDERLQEINAGIFQGLRFDEIDELHPSEAACWRAQDPDFVIPGGESRRQLMTRGLAAFEEIHAAGHAQVAVVAHGGILAAALKALLEIPAARNPFNLYNASITRLEWGQRIRLLTLNETGHLHGAGDGPPGGVGDLWPIDKPVDRSS